MRFLHQNCDPEVANDRSLPYNAYLVTYEIDGAISYDLVIPQKQMEIFDYYWDNYREGLKGWKQAEGRINPRLWESKSKSEKNKK